MKFVVGNKTFALNCTTSRHEFFAKYVYDINVFVRKPYKLFHANEGTYSVFTVDLSDFMAELVYMSEERISYRIHASIRSNEADAIDKIKLSYEGKCYFHNVSELTCIFILPQACII